MIQDDNKIENVSTTDMNAGHSGPRKVNVKAENVFKIFKQGELEVVALKKVNMKVYAGEIIVIMGPSGSGKTTLLNCIAGLERPTAGKIFVKDYDVTKMNDSGIQQLLQNEIGIVFQFFNLIPSLTAEGNIELPMTIAGKGQKYKKKRIKELLGEIGLENRAHHRPFTLSGGEKQRIAIAMAFANNPQVILADEPTGNVDSVSAKRVLGIFLEFIANNPEKSIIIVTHDPAVRKIADRTLIIKDGSIIRELGRVTVDSEAEHEDEGMQEMAKIYQMAKDKDTVDEIMNPANRAPEYDDVNTCTYCGSEHIVKRQDQDDGDFKIRNGQLLSRIALYCEECHQLQFKTASIMDIAQDF
jgi:putative ABC transport system ATP-binding protein